ncbi:P-type DNA transfer ATPase VirB11 [Variovorax sp. 770b2]|uniref:P-type DNA transfer ATPase VirB11 n=1 Tax=Variovorax sp. 770b2 TaxID=1566271 RepID=UPI0008EC877C|nr:P-type DNA transfer ATPase VirB11 [Variovorax sp. 770b2]SFQ43120.1 type IV secretion system protein VirB11 [Variovorax sp. 770b2]
MSGTTRGIDRSLTVRELMAKYGLAEALEANVTELGINKPGEHWTENAQGWHRIENDRLTLSNLHGLATAMGVYNRRPLDQDSPIASLTLPGGERCQVVLPPACLEGTISITIRKPSRSRFTLAEYEASGRLSPKLVTERTELCPWEVQLAELASRREYVRFFELAVANKLNVVTMGGTGSGKTTFSKTLIDLYPSHRRIFTVEDAHEITTPLHPNAVHLMFGPHVPAKELLASAMRMKPDHIFLAELRGDEAWDYLMALNSGHPGSVTSIHANDPLSALYKIGSYVKQSEVGQTLDLGYIMKVVKTTIDVVVAFERTYLSEIYYDPLEKLRLLRGGIL